MSQTPTLQGHAWSWWVGATVAVVLMLAPIDMRASVVALATMVVAGLLASRRIGREFAALEHVLHVLSSDDSDAYTSLRDDIPGDVGRLIRVLRARHMQQMREQGQAHEAVRRMHAMLAASPSGVLLVDSEGRIELANEALCRMIPPRSEPLGKRPIEAFSVLAVHDLVRLALAGVVPEEQEATSGDHDLSLVAVPMDGGALVMVRDVTRYHQAERARTDFVANVSHELRTPIAAILGFSETAMSESDAVPPDVQRMLAAVHRNGKRLSHLFDDLLNLYRIETRRRQLPKESILLKPMLQEAVVVAVDRAYTQGQEFELECPDDLRGWANAEALGAIVGNLASNACKYTLRGGRVRVRAERVGEEVQIRVEDTGVGIPEAHLGRIFERFYRVDDGRARSVGGTGLGLAIVKHLAMATNCSVQVASEEGVGSVFTVTVPLGPNESEERTWVHTL